MVEGSKQVRVDNWGIFFLQRLQIFFSKTDYCDLTLQFEGNVQLKVHRLVMNACTEYFTYLEQTCPALEEGTIMMPPDLQSDVIVPIVNFMYTGMLEFHMSIFEKLYKAAEIMNISVLIKLLDAQKRPPPAKGTKRKLEEVISPPLTLKTVPKGPSTSDLPSTLPGRKLPVWKRKTSQHQSSHSDYHDKWSSDPLMVPDTRPKPTRFEWPDDDLPPLALMDTAFEEISYTSKPLLTQEEENRGVPNTASTSHSSEDPRQTSPNHSKKNVGKSIIENSKVEKSRTRSESSGFEEVILFGGEEYNEIAQKRKTDGNASKCLAKKSKNGDKENKETTISVKANSNDLDHTKIVSEILKKYPNLVKKNKNIKLKIMPVSTSTSTKKTVPEKPIPGFHEIKQKMVKPDSSSTDVKHKIQTRPKKTKEKINLDGPWVCDKCDGHVEFVLYYLYRKHMTDVHNEVFDIRLCKYCGQKCSKPQLMMYHLYTKHVLRPPSSYVFPKCDQCPYIALSDSKLILHKQRHQPNEMQCVDCKLAFSNQNTLTTHIQITGHFNRTSRSSFDCQYCTKKLTSTIDLFSHIKNTHLKDAKRDGIVGLDEMDEDDEDSESDEEYIVPDILSGTNIPKDKVKIISNVKVPNRADQTTPQNEQELVPLVQTTEADSLNSVSSNIATSLGLVDIVVLDENQQYILQENQEQTEFILPELSTGDNHFGAQVITTQHSNVIPQGVLQASGTDITSTDELVMVLTDHDYQEEQEGENHDNSNIVVLYSHPVDGQQGQFITSQGNLLVNSQTGMLELRNGTTITTTSSNQIVVNSNNVDTPIESIEMIQREIESHQDLKQELYEAEKQDTVNQSQSKIDNESMTLEEITSNDVIINDFSECIAEEVEATVSSENTIQKDQSEVQQTAEQNPEMYLAEGDDQNTSEVNTETQTSNMSNQPVENIESEQPKNMETKTDDNAEIGEKSSVKEASVAKESVVDGNVQDIIDGTQEEPMEIEEIHSTDVVTENKSPEAMEIQETQETCEPKQECDGKPSASEEIITTESVDIPPRSNDIPPSSNDIPPESVDTLPESVDIPPEGVDIVPENVDITAEGADTPTDGADAPTVGADVPTVGADVPPESKQSEKQPQSSDDHESVEQPEASSSLSCNEVSERIEETNDEEMEVDGIVANKANDEINEDLPLSSQEAETETCTKSPALAIEDDQNELIVTEDAESQEPSDAPVVKQVENDDDEEDSPFIEKDVQSPLAKSTTKLQNTTKGNPNINREILEDWEEDTDSQQSDKQNTSKSNNRSEEIGSDNSKDEQRQAAVDKLMNDWEDDEEEEKRE